MMRRCDDTTKAWVPFPEVCVWGVIDPDGFANGWGWPDCRTEDARCTYCGEVREVCCGDDDEFACADCCTVDHARLRHRHFGMVQTGSPSPD